MHQKVNSTDIANLRFSNQQLEGSKFTSAKELVGWMGALQSQDFPMSKWAVGMRLQDATERMIDSAFDEGTIIRMHLLRPTWHLVAAEDVCWMLALSRAHIQMAMRSRDKELELTNAVFSKSNAILESSLRDGNHLTRPELLVKLEDAGIATDKNRASHLLMHAESEGLICSGKSKANQYTYALLPERVPNTKKLLKEEALAELARRYFLSHGPATLRDFGWWSGLSASASRLGVEMVKNELATEILEGQQFWFSQSFVGVKREMASIYLLPSYDEFIISYSDRKASLTHEDHQRAVSSNGLFRPVMIRHGKVTGIWKRELSKDKIRLATYCFQPETDELLQGIDLAIKAYGRFMQRPVAWNNTGQVI